ncbi:MAG: hypothetical protein QNK03_16730 [Myxococcota bacterium]|nr:hypothetical protein [Myxococcota bacterium]
MSVSLSMTEMHGAPVLGAGRPLLAPQGPAVVLGGVDPLAGALAPGRATLFGPRGARLFADGALYVADTGHHRVLGWRERPAEDGLAADLVLGQPDFLREGRNALGEPSALTLNVPTGVAAWGAHGLAVADAWNHRVLVWYERPTESGVPADLVLGQRDFAGGEANRGRDTASADSLHWPFQVLLAGQRLYVADAGNRRILVWHERPVENGQPADGVLGQPDLVSRSDNGGVGVGPSGLRWPHDLAVHEGNLLVGDAGNNRLLLWDGLPERDAPPALVLGQADFAQAEHNQGRYWPDASSLNMPYALDAAGGRIAVADTANSRLLGFRAPLRSGMDAVELTGQPDFGRKGDNRWSLPVRDSLCWPYGLQLAGDTAVVADSGNHRVLLWPLAADVGEAT